MWIIADHFGSFNNARNGELSKLTHTKPSRAGGFAKLMAGLLLFATAIAGGVFAYSRSHGDTRPSHRPQLAFRETKSFESGGFTSVLAMMESWPATASLEQVRDSFRHAGHKSIEKLDREFARSDLPDQKRVAFTFTRARSSITKESRSRPTTFWKS
jgi:hypothetical protein